MTPARLEEIRQRLERATPGPWKCWNGYGPIPGAPRLMGIKRIGPDHEGGLHGYSGAGRDTDGDLFATEADAELVASAPTYLSELLAEVERLQRQVVMLAKVLPLRVLGSSAQEGKP